MPSRNDVRNDTGPRCGNCNQPFPPAGRRRWCSDACRQAAWRRRHPHDDQPTELAPARSRRVDTVYECDNCGLRLIGEQRCDDCGTFMRRLGAGGLCPCCDEPIAASELTTITPTT